MKRGETALDYSPKPWPAIKIMKNIKSTKKSKSKSYKVAEEAYIAKSLEVIENFVRRRYKYYFYKDKYGNNFDYPTELIKKLDYRGDRISVGQSSYGLSFHYITYSLEEVEFFRNKADAEEYIRLYLTNKITDESNSLTWAENHGSAHKLDLSFIFKDEAIKKYKIILPNKLIKFKKTVLEDKVNKFKEVSDKELEKLKKRLKELESYKL